MRPIGERGMVHNPGMPAQPAAYRIFHNPRCSTSRHVLDALHAAGITPEVVDYLKNPPDRATLQKLARDAGDRGVRGLLRAKEALAGELGLLDPQVGDEALLDAMLAHPVLIERPIVESPKGTMVVRPKERISELLP